MAKRALVFSGRNGMDIFGLRSSVLRIPEVTLRIREAQKILDLTPDLPKIDILSSICAEDDVFFRNIQLKSLIAAIVQVGLFDRYMKSQKRPDYMVGNSNGDSAMMVCSGRQSFRSLIENSPAISSLRTSAVVVPMVAIAMPLLSGLSLTEYHAMEMKPTADGSSIEYKMMLESSMDLKKLVSSLQHDSGVTCFINIGPNSALSGSDYRAIGDGETESMDSIELDPMLAWFWPSLPSSVRLNLIASC